jgi:hypothetical protein
MTALSNYADVVNNTLLPLANQYNDARIALLAKYQAIDPAATDAQSQFDALESELAAVNTIKDTSRAAVDSANDVFLAAFAEDGAAANALSKSVTAIASATAFIPGKAAVQAAITIAIVDAAKATEAAKTSAAPPSTDPTKATAAVADGEKQGDSNANPTDARLAAGTQATPATSTATPNAGTTVAGKAGTKPAADASSFVGKRKWNPLGDFSSYTYNIGLYLMDTDEFNKYASGDHTAVSNFKLVAQSGGGAQTSRAAGLELDLYIDDLELVTYINAKETFLATNSLTFKFKIYEPFGFSFPHKLLQAQVAKRRALNAAAAPTNQVAYINALTENLLLTVKFYGYDKDGKIVTSKDYPQADSSSSDPQCVFERAFPIRITKFKFNLEGKMTVYNIEAVQVSEQIAKGTRLGGLSTSVTLSGETVQDVLSGPSQTSSKKSIQGLAQMLNTMETELVKSKNFKYANKYVIKFAPGCTIGDAMLVPKNYYNKSRTPLTVLQNPESSNVRAEWRDKIGSIDKSVKTISLNSGTSILQAIDNIITQSEYLKNMISAIDQEKSQQAKPSDATIDINPKPNNFRWFNISTSTTVLSPEKDPGRNDYAYEITYLIQDYEVPYIRTLYASASTQYYGAYKTYDYWYTGANSEVISYEQQYNFLYTMDGALSSDVHMKNQQSAVVATKSGINADASNTSDAGTNDVINSIKSFLYSPSDLQHFKLKIVGDPDYLMTSIGASGGDGTEKWYGRNSTINPNSGQVFIEIKFNQAEDYDNKTGLLVPNSDIQYMNYPPSLKEKIKGMTYMVQRVNSTFSKGKFEQTVFGTIPEFGFGDSTLVPPQREVFNAAKDSQAANPRQEPDTPAATLTDANTAPAAPPTSSSPPAGAPVSATTTQPGETTAAPVVVQQPTVVEAAVAPPTPPPYIPPNASTNSTSTFAGASLVATDNFGRVFVAATLPSGTQLPNIAGWGDSQWDGLIAAKTTKPEDIEVLASLKASYDTVVRTLSAETTAKVAANATAKTEYDTMVANWGKNSSGTANAPIGNRADDDAAK